MVFILFIRFRVWNTKINTYQKMGWNNSEVVRKVAMHGVPKKLYTDRYTENFLTAGRKKL